jgi:hypothetical protein
MSYRIRIYKSDIFQMMAIMEHAYYACFGYQVPALQNFFFFVMDAATK